MLDIDLRHGGDDSLESLKARHGPLSPTTRQAKTGGGGPHYFFRYPAGGRVVNSKANLLPGIDVKANGGYVVVPPSFLGSGERL